MMKMIEVSVWLRVTSCVVLWLWLYLLPTLLLGEKESAKLEVQEALLLLKEESEQVLKEQIIG